MRGKFLRMPLEKHGSNQREDSPAKAYTVRKQQGTDFGAEPQQKKEGLRMGYEPLPDWDDWKVREFWELGAAVALTMRMNPPFVQAHFPNPMGLVPVGTLPAEFPEHEARKYQRFLREAVKAEKEGSLVVYDNLDVPESSRNIGLHHEVWVRWVKPREFLVWVRSGHCSIPNALGSLLDSREANAAKGGAPKPPIEALEQLTPRSPKTKKRGRPQSNDPKVDRKMLDIWDEWRKKNPKIPTYKKCFDQRELNEEGNRISSISTGKITSARDFRLACKREKERRRSMKE